MAASTDLDSRFRPNSPSVTDRKWWKGALRGVSDVRDEEYRAAVAPDDPCRQQGHHLVSGRRLRVVVPQQREQRVESGR